MITLRSESIYSASLELVFDTHCYQPTTNQQFWYATKVLTLYFSCRRWKLLKHTEQKQYQGSHVSNFIVCPGLFLLQQVQKEISIGNWSLFVSETDDNQLDQILWGVFKCKFNDNTWKSEDADILQHSVSLLIEL